MRTSRFFHGAQPKRHAAETYIFFRRWKIMLFICELKFLKIREKVFLQSLDWEDEQNLKTNIFSNSTSLKLPFVLCHGILLLPVPEIAVFFGPPYCTYCISDNSGIRGSKRIIVTVSQNLVFLCVFLKFKKYNFDYFWLDFRKQRTQHYLARPSAMQIRIIISNIIYL